MTLLGISASDVAMRNKMRTAYISLLIQQQAIQRGATLPSRGPGQLTSGDLSEIQTAIGDITVEERDPILVSNSR